MHYTFILYEVLFKQTSIMEKVEIRKVVSGPMYICVYSHTQLPLVYKTLIF